MATESNVSLGGITSRARVIRRRCLLATLAFTAVLAATTFDFQPLLPDNGGYDWTMLVLGTYVWVIWPASILGLVGSVVLYVATMIRPHSVVAKLMPERPAQDTTKAR